MVGRAILLRHEGEGRVADVSVLDCGPLIEELERDLGLSVEITARALSVDRRTIERWRTNQSAPQGKARERLGELLALRKRLLAQFGTPDGTREWLHAPSLYLGGSTPLEALKAGRIDRVQADLDGLAAGVFL